MVLLAALAALVSLVLEARVSPDPPRSAAQGETWVQVVDPHGRPLGGAEVRVALQGRQSSGEDRTQELERAPLVSQVDDLLRAQPVLRADGLGRLCVLWPRGRALLLSGRSEQHWGFAWFPGDWRERPQPGRLPGEALRLELCPDFDVAVLVLDENGARCADATVSLSLGPSTRLRGQRTPEGWAFAHAGFQGWHSPYPLTASLEGSLLRPEQARLEPRQAPAGPIVLQRPRTGSVLVRLLASDGRPAPESCYVELGPAEDPRPADERRFDRRPPRVGKSSWRGSARFSAVPLGVDLVVSVDGEGARARARFAGPTSPGETATVEVRLEPVTERARVRGEASTGLLLPPGVRVEGELAGRLLLDPEVPAREIQLALTSEARHENGVPWSSTQHGGSFRFMGVPSGPARLSIRVADEPVHELALDVQPGQNADARLAAIDLRGKIGLHRVHLTGFDPAWPFHARLFVQPAGEPARRAHVLHTHEASPLIASPWPALDVEVFAPGYRSAVLPDLRGDATLALEPGLRVRLRLVLDGALPEPPRYLKAALVYADRPERGIDWEGPAFGPTREIVLHAWGPGRMRVLWILSEHADLAVARGGGVGLELSPPQEIQVLERAEEQVFEVPLSAEELALALRRH